VPIVLAILSEPLVAGDRKKEVAFARIGFLPLAALVLVDGVGLDLPRLTSSLRRNQSRRKRT